MKYFFIFLFLLPCTFAIAVSPISLDFNENSSFMERDLLIINNLDVGADYKLHTNLFVEPTSIYLEPQEQYIFKIIFNSSIHNYSDYILIDEIKQNSLILNSVKIPITNTSFDTNFSLNHEKILNVNKEINQTRLTKPSTIVKGGIDYKRYIFFIIGAILIISIIFYFIKFYPNFFNFKLKN